VDFGGDLLQHNVAITIRFGLRNNVYLLNSCIMTLSESLCYNVKLEDKWVKGKVIPLQAWCGPEGG